jgi:hypothetical protein
MIDLEQRLAYSAASAMLPPDAGGNPAAALLQWSYQAYQRYSTRGRWQRAWARMRRRRWELWRLRDLRPRGEHYTGHRTVALDLIRGSEDRAEDFDRDFFPLGHHNRNRWMGIAMARQQGIAMPAVQLIQVGDLYFVRDGHHRISVARALGEAYVEAEVTVWEVAGPLPWEMATVAVATVARPATA